MLCNQFLARAVQPDNTSHAVVTSNLEPENIWHTLRTAFIDSDYQQRYTDTGTRNGVVQARSYKKVIKSIHTESVRKALDDLEPNRVLNSRPPLVSTDEQSLPRAHRTTLSRLRSGYCPALNSYQASIGTSTTDRCPSCRLAAHTTAHLFNCPEHPTNLDTLDLWRRPVEVSDFVAGLPGFNLPSRRPPPEPPP